MSRLSLAGRTIFITGASRGIGKAIGIRAAKDGANVVIAAKTSDPNPKLPGTIHSAAKEGSIFSTNASYEYNTVVLTVFSTFGILYNLFSPKCSVFWTNAMIWKLTSRI